MHGGSGGWKWSLLVRCLGENGLNADYTDVEHHTHNTEDDCSQFSPLTTKWIAVNSGRLAYIYSSRSVFSFTTYLDVDFYLYFAQLNISVAVNDPLLSIIWNQIFKLFKLLLAFEFLTLIMKIN